MANGRPPYELQDESATLSRITSDLRRRMESANYWLDASSAPHDSEAEEYGIILATDCTPRVALPENSSRRPAKKMKSQLIGRPNSKFTDDYTNFNQDDTENIDTLDMKRDDEGIESSKVGASTIMPCMCKKSHCLKLYCECFNKEQYCSGCFCIGCNNTPRHDSVREKAIADIKRRNPDAFTPKIKTSIECKCKRTACIKKYCECFLHGVYCGEACQCKMCLNVDRRGPDSNSGLVQKVNGSAPLLVSASANVDSLERLSATKRPARTPKSNTITPPPKSALCDGDIVLSLKNDEYKDTMFSKFRKMGKRLGPENAELDIAKHELFSAFKQIMGKDGRFLRTDRHFRDLWVADDDEAIHSKSVWFCTYASLGLNYLIIPLLHSFNQKLRVI